MADEPQIPDHGGSPTSASDELTEADRFAYMDEPTDSEAGDAEYNPDVWRLRGRVRRLDQQTRINATSSLMREVLRLRDEREEARAAVAARDAELAKLRTAANSEIAELRERLQKETPEIGPAADAHAVTDIACILDDLPPLPEPGDATAAPGTNYPHRLHRNHDFYYMCPVCSKDTTELAAALVAAGYRLVRVGGAP